MTPRPDALALALCLLLTGCPEKGPGGTTVDNNTMLPCLTSTRARVAATPEMGYLGD